MDIFLSRPIWVAEEYRSGLDQFERLIKEIGLKPRTLGATDYATKCPLDEVIRLLDECRGAIILGYPQITVTEGELEGEALRAPLLLPTEWNHIEAGLAYARDLPLLVIHHVGVQRGIFDRGAMPSFLHEVDMADAAWPLAKQISGAVTKWKSEVVEQKSQTNVKLRKPLTDELVRVLQILAKPRHEKLDSVSLARRLHIANQRSQYLLDELLEANLVYAPATGRPTQYNLTKAGRAALVERGLL